MGENFRIKARIVASNKSTNVPSSFRYSSAIFSYYVQIAFTVAALNDLKVLGCDI